jgi:hypothetical protein
LPPSSEPTNKLCLLPASRWVPDWLNFRP